jgi:PiT family inorganic phosphate transporter
MTFLLENPYTILIIASMLGFFMAWGIGANDVANAMGTSVGSRAITLKQAVIIAAIFEFLGAFLAGGEVTSTIRKEIVDPTIYNDKPTIFVIGMMSCLLAAGFWLLFASRRGWPVSTTHSIVGAIVGFALITKGTSSVEWSKLGEIASSWVTSPLIAGVLAFCIYLSAKKLILERQNKLAAAVNIIPFYAFLVTLVICLVTAKKGLKYVGVNWTDNEVIIFSLSLSLMTLIGTFIFLKVNASFLQSNNKYGTGGVEGAFGILMVVTACSLAFAHGSNDVANAIGPLAAIVNVVQSGGVIAVDSTSPAWILLIGAAGIVFGLATLGHKVIKTVGEKITKLTPSLGFSANMSASTTIVLATYLGFPISTTHTLVGAVIGVGLVNSVNALDLKQIYRIILSWLVTIPMGAFLTILFYVLLRFIFGI